MGGPLYRAPTRSARLRMAVPAAIGWAVGDIAAGLLATIWGFTSLYGSGRPYLNRGAYLGGVAASLAAAVTLGDWGLPLAGGADGLGDRGGGGTGLPRAEYRTGLVPTCSSSRVPPVPERSRHPSTLARRAIWPRLRSPRRKPAPTAGTCRWAPSGCWLPRRRASVARHGNGLPPNDYALP